MDVILKPELQEYYDNRFRLFGTQGWKDLIEDIQKMYQTTNNIKIVSNQEILFFRKGELSIMEWILNLEEISKKAYDELVMEESDDNL